MRKPLVFALLLCLAASIAPSASGKCGSFLTINSGDQGPLPTPGSIEQWADMACDVDSDPNFICTAQAYLVVNASCSCFGGTMKTTIKTNYNEYSDSLIGKASITFILIDQGVVEYSVEGYSSCSGLNYGDSLYAPCPY